MTDQNGKLEFERQFDGVNVGAATRRPRGTGYEFAGTKAK